MLSAVALLGSGGAAIPHPTQHSLIQQDLPEPPPPNSESIDVPFSYGVPFKITDTGAARAPCGKNAQLLDFGKSQVGEFDSNTLVRYNNLGEINGDSFYMTIKNFTTYHPGTSNGLTGKHGDFGHIEMKSGTSTDFVLRFYTHKDNKPVSLPHFFMTFFDSDQSHMCAESTVFNTDDIENIYLSNDTKISLSRANDKNKISKTFFNSTMTQVWGDNPKKANELTAEQLAKSYTIEFTNKKKIKATIATFDVNPAKNYVCRDPDGSRNFYFAGYSLETPCQVGGPPFIGYDPIFNINGEQVEFWLPPSEPTSILFWRGGQKMDRLMELRGTVFERGEKRMQWFNELEVRVDGKAAVRIKMNNPDDLTMLAKKAEKEHPDKFDKVFGVWVDDEPLQGDSMGSKKADVQAHLKTSEEHAIGSLFAEELTIKSGEFELLIWAVGAKKFTQTEDQLRYGHLNVRFVSGLPKSSKGFFAELSGMQPISAESKAYLVKPKGALVD